MASLSTDGRGNKTIQVVCPDGKRRSIRLGKVNKKLAEGVRLKIEHLAAAVGSQLPLDRETAAWVRELGAELHDKLAAVGLLPKRESATLGNFLDAFVEGRRACLKGSTVNSINQVRIDLIQLYGREFDVRSFTPTMADGLLLEYARRKLAGGSSSRRIKVARMFFKAALRQGLIDANPFAGVQSPSAKPNPARQAYVPRAIVLTVLGHCSPDWQLVGALSRFAGLRAASEVLSLRWADIDLASGVMVVRSPKTEHHAGGESRRVPIFPDLRPFLNDAFDRAAGQGAVHVVNGFGERLRQKAATHHRGWNAVSLSTPFGKLIKRAGFSVWPKVMHNMRASLETDLMASHPIHVVCAWLGNTPKVALGHYLQTLEGDFLKALEALPTPRPCLPRSGAESGAVGAELVQIPVQTGVDSAGPDQTDSCEMPAICGDLSKPVNSSPNLSELIRHPGGTHTELQNTLETCGSRCSDSNSGADSGASSRTGQFRALVGSLTDAERLILANVLGEFLAATASGQTH